MANAAFYYGMVMALVSRAEPAEALLDFDKARDNFYRASQLGLRTTVHWLDGKQHTLQDLILHELLPLAREGLAKLEIATTDIDDYLAVVHERVSSGMNGTAWQRAFTAKHGRDMRALLQAYRDRQYSGEPVHRWTI